MSLLINNPIEKCVYCNKRFYVNKYSKACKKYCNSICRNASYKTTFYPTKIKPKKKKKPKMESLATYWCYFCQERWNNRYYGGHYPRPEYEGSGQYCPHCHIKQFGITESDIPLMELRKLIYGKLLIHKQDREILEQAILMNFPYQGKATLEEYKEKEILLKTITTKNEVSKNKDN